MNSLSAGSAPSERIGFTGKLPDNADFVTRFLPPVFTAFWDRWIDEGMQASKLRLGEAWRPAFLVAPVWHFSILPGLLGETGWIGVMIPSVDRAGRYYPLTVAASSVFAQHHRPEAELLLERLEPIAIAALDEGITVQDLEELCRQEEINSAETLGCPSTEAIPDRPGARFKFSLNLHHATSALSISGPGAKLFLESGSCFWSSGSPYLNPALHYFEALPTSLFFVEMLKDDVCLADPEISFSHPSDATRKDDLLGRATHIAGVSRVQGAGRTHSGQRAINQDALLLRPDCGLWAVADGMGGHELGERASQLVIDLLAQLPPSRYLETLMGRVIKSLTIANEELQSISQKELSGHITGSTFVGLVMDARNAYVVWVGDSRIYRLRGGQFEQLTRDHSSVTVQGRSVLSRAVGGTHQVDIDTRRISIVPGDQFLLCSDGLYRTVNDQEMTSLLQSGTLEERADALMELALRREAQDNVTLVIVETPQESATGE